MKYATSWNGEKGLGVVGLRCPNHSLGGIALWRRAVGFTALPWRGDERPPDAGSRSVARRENGARLASGACSRRRRFCSFALAVLAVLATLAPEQAAAQTVTTFLSNTGQSANTSTNTVRATAFTTGTGTYTLSSVAIYSPIQSTSPTPVVQIYRDSSGNPGTLVATMTNPATVADNTLNVYTAPANTTLAASTTYWVVTSNSVNNFGTDFRVSTNNNNNVDSGTAAGWTIGNGLFKTDVRLAPWTTSSNRHRFQIRGTAQTTTTNSAPTVANVIPDQTATAGTAFSYQFPTNTFNDTDTGDTLSYAAAKADGTMLPMWLSFTDSTRTFAGTPAVADTGTVSVKVTRERRQRRVDQRRIRYHGDPDPLRQQHRADHFHEQRLPPRLGRCSGIHDRRQQRRLHAVEHRGPPPERRPGHHQLPHRQGLQRLGDRGRRSPR